MSTRAWSIRTLFPLMAGSIIVSALVTAGGAMVAARQADEARLAVKSRMDAQILVDQIAFLDQGVQMYNVVAKFVPGQARSPIQARLLHVSLGVKTDRLVGPGSPLLWPPSAFRRAPVSACRGPRITTRSPKELHCLPPIQAPIA
jgi:hypothetical protein